MHRPRRDPSPKTRAISRKLHKRNLQRQNERLQLLLNLTNRITSNLELREVLRATSANIRELMECDAVGIALIDAAGNPFLRPSKH
jgi:transcriptional regulator with GAF, ATPase, and Fis domain